jgi:hypothetical protein
VQNVQNSNAKQHLSPIRDSHQAEENNEHFLLYAAIPPTRHGHHAKKYTHKFQLYTAIPPSRDDNHKVENCENGQLYAAIPPSRDEIIKLKSAVILKIFITCYTRRSTLRFGCFGRRERA